MTVYQAGDYRTTDMMSHELLKQSSRVLNKICHQPDEICRCAKLAQLQNVLPDQVIHNFGSSIRRFRIADSDLLPVSPHFQNTWAYSTFFISTATQKFHFV